MSDNGCSANRVSSNSELVLHSGVEAALDVLVPFDLLDGVPLVEFAVVVERAGIIVQRLPQSRTIPVAIPGPEFDALHWSA